MPLLEYKCVECKKRFSLLIGVVAERQDETCPNCGSANVKKLISRFARLRSQDDMIETLSDPAKMGDLDDPRQLHGWMKRMGKEMGEDIGDDFDEMLDEAEAGEDDAADLDL